MPRKPSQNKKDYDYWNNYLLKTSTTLVMPLVKFVSVKLTVGYYLI